MGDPQFRSPSQTFPLRIYGLRFPPLSPRRFPTPLPRAFLRISAPLSGKGHAHRHTLVPFLSHRSWRWAASSPPAHPALLRAQRSLIHTGKRRRNYLLLFFSFLPFTLPPGSGFPQPGAALPPAKARQSPGAQPSCGRSAQRDRASQSCGRGVRFSELSPGSFYGATVRAPWMKLSGTQTN